MPQEQCAIVMTHGLAKKPAPSALLNIWCEALSMDDPRPDVFLPPNPGIQVENSFLSLLNYWADVFYGEDYETDLASYAEASEDTDTPRSLDLEGGEIELPTPENQREADFLAGFVAKLSAQPGPPVGLADQPQARAAAGAERLERIPLPAFAKEAIIKKAAMEAYYFLFNKPFKRADGKVFDTRTELRSRLVRDLAAARAQARRVVLVSHSMGTMVAYDVLRNCPDCPVIDGLITLGSPLGVDEVQDGLIPAGKSKVDFPSEKLAGTWINVYDKFDIVCAADPRLANDFLRGGQPVIRDVNEQNWSNWRHSITHYLKGPRMRQALRELAGL